MSQADPATPEQVEQLLLNARLRDELEPFMDESVQWIDKTAVPTEVENEFLSAMLAWERAPIVPIAQWFPDLELPSPDKLDANQLHYKLWETIHALAEKRIVLDFTDHLSDRELYTLILRDILPAEEKQIEGAGHTLHWDCAESEDGESEVWLRYYASDHDRSDWLKEHGGPIPPREEPPYPRKMPK